MTRTLLITGGSRGIGAASARLAVERDFRVAINYLQNAQASTTIKSHIEAAGGTAMVIQADVANPVDVARMFQSVEDQLGPVDALVNSAGMSGNECRVADYNLAVLERMMWVNVMGTIICCREAIRRMSTSLGGRGAPSLTFPRWRQRLAGAPGLVTTPLLKLR